MDAFETLEKIEHVTVSKIFLEHAKQSNTQSSCKVFHIIATAFLSIRLRVDQTFKVTIYLNQFNKIFS